MVEKGMIRYLIAVVLCGSTIGLAGPHSSADSPTGRASTVNFQKPSESEPRSPAPDYTHFVCTNESLRMTIIVDTGSSAKESSFELQNIRVVGDRVKIERDHHTIRVNAILQSELQRSAEMRIDASQRDQNTKVKWVGEGKVPRSTELSCHGEAISTDPASKSKPTERAPLLTSRPLINLESELANQMTREGYDPMEDNIKTLNRVRASLGKPLLYLPGEAEALRTKFGYQIEPLLFDIKILNIERFAEGKSQLFDPSLVTSDYHFMVRDSHGAWIENIRTLIKEGH